MSIPFKPAAFFGRDIPDAGFRKLFGRTGTVSFDGPAAPVIDVQPGVNDGEVDILIDALPLNWGDLLVAEDGLGVIGILEWWNAVDGWQELCDPAMADIFIVNVHHSLWGTSAEIRVRGVSAGAVPGFTDSMFVDVPGTTMVLDTLTNQGDPMNAAGDPMTVLVPA